MGRDSRDVSSRVRQVLRVCLQKDPRQRARPSATCAWPWRARSRRLRLHHRPTRTVVLDGRVRYRSSIGHRTYHSGLAVSDRGAAQSPPETRADIVFARHSRSPFICTLTRRSPASCSSLPVTAHPACGCGPPPPPRSRWPEPRGQVIPSGRPIASPSASSQRGS